MPWWQPEWDDVQFDHAAAEAALEACRTTLATIEEAADWSRRRHVVQRDWRGRFRDAFDVRLDEVAVDLGRNALDLATLAAAIEGAAAAAREEQASREALRAAWHAERARELALTGGA